MEIEPQEPNAKDPRKVIKNRHKVDPETGCWEWEGYVKKENGYGELSVNGSNKYAHRVSYVIHNGEIPDGKWVLHKCHNKTCVNPDHLYLGDVRDNVQDSMEEGSFWNGGQLKEGEENLSSKLTEDAVREIRELYENTDMTQRELSKKFETSVGNVNRIVNYVTWTHI